MRRAGPAAALVLLLGLAVPAGGGEPEGIPPPTDPYPRAAAAYRVAVNGVTLWERAADRPLAPASLTKLMTALVLVESGWDGAAPVTVSPLAAAATGSRLGLRPGEVFRAEDLLAGLLVASGNDACLALAEHRSGTVTSFVAAMNRRARELGLRNTRFANPCGLDAPGQQSTVADLEVLARKAMDQPLLADLVARPDGVITSRAGRELRFTTGNQLLGRVEGVRGVKSGFTSRAGKCLVALAERNGDQVLVILLNAPDRWWSAAVLVEDAFRALADARR